MDIRIGVAVAAEDGNAGRVSGIILHPESQEVEGIVAEQGGMLAHDVVIPIERIVSAGEDVVRVRGTVDEISECPAFAQSQYVEPPDEWIPPLGGPPTHYLFPATPYSVGAFTFPSVQGAPPEHEVENLEPGDVEVAADTQVYLRDGSTVGRVERVVTEGDSDRVSHLVVSRTAGKDVMVGVDRVARMGEDGIHLQLDEVELDTLPAAAD
ncbi:MAG: PRC-barrel domain-containing protein [Armatimonadota bacterium]